MKNIELLAPAGEYEKLKLALHYGADAVYFGGQNYGMRANANNFSMDDIREATNLAHSLNKKVYVTVNIVFHDNDFFGLEEYLVELNEIGVDAIIISDPSVLYIVKKLGLNLEMHLSTQASTLNHKNAKFWIDEGISRIVMAREAHRDDIKRIKEETGVEIECFIHGAMCVSFSGSCVMSNYATLRDANRGGCAQICRWLFDVGCQNEFSMTPKDLNSLLYIQDMISIGVNSFKVEGRMRSVYYIATVMNVYRNIIDKIRNNSLNEAYTNYYLNILNRCANRESISQFYNAIPGVNEQYFNSRDEVSNQDFLGIIKAYDGNSKMAIIEQRNYFKLGDEVEVFGPNTKPFTFKIEKILDESDNEIDVARHPKMVVKIPIYGDVVENDMLRVKVFDFSNF